MRIHLIQNARRHKVAQGAATVVAAMALIIIAMFVVDAPIMSSAPHETPVESRAVLRGPIVDNGMVWLSPFDGDHEMAIGVPFGGDMAMLVPSQPEAQASATPEATTPPGNVPANLSTSHEASQ